MVGTLDIESAIREGKNVLNRGSWQKPTEYSYVDEINLLDDHVVDVLLDAAAMGS